MNGGLLVNPACNIKPTQSNPNRNGDVALWTLRSALQPALVHAPTTALASAPVHAPDSVSVPAAVPAAAAPDLNSL